MTWNNRPKADPNNPMRQWLKEKRKLKFGSVKSSADGYSFASKLELAVYGMLKLRMKAGEIKSIQVQDHILLSEAEIKYIADFKCIGSDGQPLWIEAKGFSTPEWKIKLKLWRAYGPGPLEIWQGSWQRPFLSEVIKGE